MCGIVGYIGKRQASNLLVEGLSKLEYRGSVKKNMQVFWESFRDSTVQ